MVLLQWYKELFKRVEGTQKYMIEINNKSTLQSQTQLTQFRQNVYPG